MTYSLTATTSVRRDIDGTIIPADDANTDWREYQAWLAEGNTPTPYAPPPAPAPILTFLEFMALFTPAEQETIVNATDLKVRLFLLRATGASYIQLDNPELVAGVDYLASGPGLIAASRVAEILAGAPPAA